MNHWTIDTLSGTTTLRSTAATRSHHFKLIELSLHHPQDAISIILKLSLSPANQFILIQDGEGLTIDGETLACTVLSLSLHGLTLRFDGVEAYHQCSRYIAFSVAVPDIKRSIVGQQCRSCRNFHGKRYGHHALICAIHPYGQTDCSDWEAKPIPVGRN